MTYPTQPGKATRADTVHDAVASFFPLLLVPIAFVISQYAGQNPEWAETYSLAFSRFIAQPISFALGIFPFSIAEIILGMAVISFFITMFMHLLRRDWLRLVAHPLALAAIFYSFFTAGWGVAYSRQPYAYTAGLTVAGASVEELQALCAGLVGRANALREGAREDEHGVYATRATGRELLSMTQEAFDAASTHYPWLSGQYGNPKPVALSEQMSYLQITGIFIPYTLEANVNMNNSIYMIPATACHEAAHLRGWAREDEANYIAYAVCMQSDNVDFQYSGALLGLTHAMNALYGASSEAYWSVRELYSEGLVRDLSADAEHWRQYEGKAAEMQEQINDTYLKANRQEDGVRSYGRMVDLMIAQMREDMLII